MKKIDFSTLHYLCKDRGDCQRGSIVKKLITQLLYIVEHWSSFCCRLLI